MSSVLFKPVDQASQSRPMIPQINPNQINMIKSFLQGKGVSAEQMVRNICQQRGIDVDAFMAQFK